MVQGDRRSWGRSAILAGSLWAASVAAELIFRPQRPDGSVENMAVFAVSLAAAVVGSLFLVHAFHGLRKLVTASGTRSLISRVGAWCAVLGAALLVLFTLLGLASGLVTGKVWEPSFLVFALAMLLLLLGQVTVGITSRRPARPRPAAHGRRSMRTGGRRRAGRSLARHRLVLAVRVLDRCGAAAPTDPHRGAGQGRARPTYWVRARRASWRARRSGSGVRYRRVTARTTSTAVAKSMRQPGCTASGRTPD